MSVKVSHYDTVITEVKKTVKVRLEIRRTTEYKMEILFMLTRTLLMVVARRDAQR